MLDVGEGQAERQIVLASTILAMTPPVFMVVIMQKCIEIACKLDY
jgi:ABC-type glycerol-3-phosphate transport system permease component